MQIYKNYFNQGVKFKFYITINGIQNQDIHISTGIKGFSFYHQVHLKHIYFRNVNETSSG